MHLMRFAKADQPVAARHVFIRRLATNIAIALILIGGSLAIGVLGYRYIAGQSWPDAIEEAVP
jgi:hypothetical protein